MKLVASAWRLLRCVLVLVEPVFYGEHFWIGFEDGTGRLRCEVSALKCSELFFM
jgi:hypothetical protein